MTPFRVGVAREKRGVPYSPITILTFSTISSISTDRRSFPRQTNPCLKQSLRGSIQKGPAFWKRGCMCIGFHKGWSLSLMVQGVRIFSRLVWNKRQVIHRFETGHSFPVASLPRQSAQRSGVGIKNSPSCCYIFLSTFPGYQSIAALRNLTDS